MTLTDADIKTCERCLSTAPDVCYRPHWSPELCLCAGCDNDLIIAYHDSNLLGGRSLHHEAVERAPELITQRRADRHRIAAYVNQQQTEAQRKALVNAITAGPKVSDLRMKRLAAGLRIIDVAYETGLTPTRISQLERGEGTPAHRDELNAYTALLDRAGTQ